MDNISNIMAAIVAIMKNNGLTELSLGDYAEQEDPTFIIGSITTELLTTTRPSKSSWRTPKSRSKWRPVTSPTT